MSVDVRVVDAVTPELVRAINALLPQLSSSPVFLEDDDLARIVNSEASALFVAETNGAVVGTLTLVMFVIPTGTRAWIEDVVVDEALRGRGVGRALVAAALEEARRRGVTTVDLTSRPSREAANLMYQRQGFVKRDTNVYRYLIE